MDKLFFKIFLWVILCLNSNNAFSQDVLPQELVDSVIENEKLACYYDSLGDNNMAICYAEKNVSINRKFGDTSVPYAISLLKLARYEKKIIANDAITTKGLAILKDSLGTKSSIYINYLLESAWRRFVNNQIQEACDMVKDIADNNYNGEESYLGYLYYSYAHFLKGAEERELAIEYGKKAEFIFTEREMWSDDYYSKTLMDLGILCASSQEVSLNYLNKAKQNIEKYKGKDCMDYLDVLLDLAYLFRATNRFEEALNYAKQAKETGEKLKDLDYGSYLYTLDFLAGRYSSLHQYSEAIKYAEKCLTLMKESNDFDLEDRLPTLDSLVAYNWKVGDKENIEKCNLCAKEAYLIRKSLKMTDIELVRNIDYLLHTNYYLGKTDECENNIKEVKAMYGEAYSTNYTHYYEDMNLLANIFFYKEKYKEALAVLEEMEFNYGDQYGKNDDFFADILIYQAKIYSLMGIKEAYLNLSQKGLNIKKTLFGEFSKKYLNYLSQCASEYNQLGFVKESYDMYKQSAIIAKKVFGTQHLQFVYNFLCAMTLWNGEDIIDFDDYKLKNLLTYYRFYKSIREIDENRSVDVGEVMNNNKNLLLLSLPQILRKYSNDSQSLKAFYDCILLFKTNHAEFEKEVVNELPDNAHKDLYNSIKIYLDGLMVSDRGVLDSLYEDINNQEIKLSQSFSSFFDYYHKRMITSDTLMCHMPDKSVIIDYIPMKMLSTGYNDYIVSYDNKSEYPQLILVNNASEQVNQICERYNTVYLLVDNDTIISSLGIRLDTSKSYIIGYATCIDKIMNRDNSPQRTQRDLIIHGDDFILSRKEFEKGVELYNKKQYALAIDAFYRSDSLMYMVKGDESCFFGHGKQWIASCCYKMGKDSIAKQISEYYDQEPIDMRLTIVSDSILDYADSLYQKGDIESALKKYLEASDVEKKNLGEKSYWYANTLSHCADLCIELGNYEKAIDLESQALIIRKELLGLDHEDYYLSLKNLFELYTESENKPELFEYGELLIEYMERNKNRMGHEIVLYPVQTYSLAKLYAEDNNHIKALEYCKKTIESSQLIADLPDSYTELYHGVILTLKVLGEDSLAFELCKQIIPIYEKDEKLKNSEKHNYSDLLNIVGSHYFYYGDFISACLYQEKALGFLSPNDTSRYGITIGNLSLTYCELGRIEEATKMADEAVFLCEEDSSMIKDKRIYAKGLLNLAHCYSIANRPKDALRIGKKAYNLLKEEYGLGLKETLGAANNLATYYGELGYYDEVGKLLFSVIEYAEKDIKNYGDVLGTAYNNLAMEWAREIMDFQSSLKFVDKAYEIRKEVLGENSLFTIQSLYNKGRCLLDLGRISEGIDCVSRALFQTKSLVGDNNLRYIEMMKILTNVYGNAGDFNRALQIEEERSSLLKKIVGERHVSFLHSIDNLSELYFCINDTIKLNNTIIDALNKYREMVITDFPNYTSVERANVINGMGRFFDWLFPLVCYYKGQPTLYSELYNALLLRKGILLNSEIEFIRLIRERGNTALISRYNELIANRNILNKQYQLPVEQRKFDIDSLKHTINEDEDYLISASKEYGEYTQNFRTNWKDIRNKLNEDELAVEFVVFDDTCNIKNRIYYALVINNQSEYPEFVPLCLEAQILENGKQVGELYQLIWGPILNNRKKTKTVFFSPSGILNNVGIEYIDINDNENVSDKYILHRLSSTREIIENRKSSYKSAALFGGLEYAVDTDVLLSQNVKSEEEINPSVMYRGLSDSLSVRNSFEPLYNTRTEVSEIGQTLKQRELIVSIFSGIYGTEESFKKLSGKGMNLIHLATHGMYIGASEAETRRKDTNLSFIQLDENDRGFIQEEISLSRSFLVMSGGDMLPNHKVVPDNLEDGILTASEISKLDFRGLDLVVLSACQTALGDVDNEGVYGLQRGFKKAGANTILMSLDKVDDEATKILMVEFYKNLMEGKSKHQSLKDAQHHLRQVENGRYDDPKYWASFIMLDGLN